MKSFKDIESREVKSIVKLLDALHDRYEGLYPIELERTTGLVHSTVASKMKKMENFGWVNKDKDGRYTRREKGTALLFEYFRAAYWNAETIDETPLAVPIGDFTVKAAQGMFKVGSGVVYGRGDWPAEENGEERLNNFRKLIHSEGKRMAQNWIKTIQSPESPMVFEKVTVRFCAKRVHDVTAPAKPDDLPPDGNGRVKPSASLTVWEDK